MTGRMCSTSTATLIKICTVSQVHPRVGLCQHWLPLILWVWGVQTQMRLLHYRVQPPQRSTVSSRCQQTTKQQEPERAAAAAAAIPPVNMSKHSPALDWGLSCSCSLQVQVLQHHHFGRKVWAREVETTITLGAPMMHFNERAQTSHALDKRYPAQH